MCLSFPFAHMSSPDLMVLQHSLQFPNLLSIIAKHLKCYLNSEELRRFPFPLIHYRL